MNKITRLNFILLFLCLFSAQLKGQVNDSTIHFSITLKYFVDFENEYKYVVNHSSLEVYKIKHTIGQKTSYNETKKAYTLPLNNQQKQIIDSLVYISDIYNMVKTYEENIIDGWQLTFVFYEDPTERKIILINYEQEQLFKLLHQLNLFLPKKHRYISL